MGAELHETRASSFRGGGLQKNRSRLLVLIEAAIGDFQKFLSGAAVLWKNGDADAYGEARRIRFEGKAIAYAGGNLFAAFIVRINQQDAKFIAAVTSGDVRGA